MNDEMGLCARSRLYSRAKRSHLQRFTQDSIGLSIPLLQRPRVDRRRSIRYLVQYPAMLHCQADPLVQGATGIANISCYCMNAGTNASIWLVECHMHLWSLLQIDMFLPALLTSVFFVFLRQIVTFEHWLTLLWLKNVFPFSFESLSCKPPMILLAKIHSFRILMAHLS